MTAFLRERAADAVEQMDRPDCDPRKLDHSYSRFNLVNGAIAGWHGIYRELLKPVLTTSDSPTLLDIGCGGGDVARGLARLAAEDGILLQVTAIDPDERAFRFASRAPGTENVTYRQAHSADLVNEGHRYDAVISNHILHHLDPDELAGLLHDSEVLCGRLAIHNDIERSPVAFGLFAAGAWTLGIGSYILQDGLTSIRRSYTAAELRTAAPRGWVVERRRPWRNLLIYRPENGSA